jgi:initiation factor 1A
MVKNITGGKKAKQSGRKSFSGSNRLKTSQDECEVYAIVLKMMGGRVCEVKCNDGEVRLCHIRGIFSGKNKGSNFIRKGVWVLVGLREWASVIDGKRQDCDLICVYSDKDKEQILQLSVNLSVLQKEENILNEIDDKHETSIIMENGPDEVDFDDI